ncbi:unnamed protein product [Dimorphilus gyrociliatus]|uniref:Aminotransferase class I/classII large domain-containing protein n=1 Tax=Dimorphilus gyrociliatus TaxID=2664684 RepID=A0A7I8V3X2_9ANNE|nr:unnamed protein product [Dimorphilus gyrociliatus]
MDLPKTFKLERYFAQYEFDNTKKLLCCSDAESFDLKTLLSLGSSEDVEKWNNLKLCYTDSQGSLELRTEISKLQDINPENILVCVPAEGIFIALTCLAKELKGKKAIVCWPCYQSLIEVLESNGVTTDKWLARYSSEKGWYFDMNELRGLIKDNVGLVVVNFPHNPTSFLPSTDEFNELIKLCKENDIYLFSDEMYRMTERSIPHLSSACSVYDKAISLSGLSKSFGLPGLRVGWLCCQNDEILGKFKGLKDYLTICSSSPTEALGVIALKNRDALTTTIQLIIKKNLSLVSALAVKYQELIEWHEPKAGTTGFMKLREKLLKGRTATDVCAELVDKFNIVLLPAKTYQYEDKYVRFGFARKDMEILLTDFDNFLSQYAN